MSNIINKHHRVVAVYAKALFDSAEEKQTFDILLGQLKTILDFVEGNQSITKIMQAPIITNLEKISLIKVICKQLNLGDQAHNFLKILINNRRFSYFKDIIRCFENLQNQHHNIKIIEVVTAVKMSSDQQNELLKKLEKNFNSKLKILNKIDTSIIGGAIIYDGTKMYDGSIRNRLKRLKENTIQELYTM